MTTRNTLPAVRLYTATDPYFYTTDNRPLTDLVTSDQVLADAIDNMASFTQSGTGAVSGPAQTELRYFVRPEQFGAIGDGATDDAVAVAAAITQAQSSGRTLRLTKNYKVNTGLTITNSIQIDADRGAALTGAAGITVLTVATAVSDKIVQIEGLLFSGGAIGLDTNTSGGAGYLSRKSFFRDLSFAGQTDRGWKNTIGLIGTVNGPMNFENTGSYGLWSEGDDLLNATEWNGVRATSSTAAGVYIKQSVVGPDHPAITFINSIMETNGKYGLYAYGSRILLVNPWFESNGSAGDGGSTLYADIQMDGNATNKNVVTIKGGYFSAPHANQANLRVFFNNTGQVFSVDSTRFPGSSIIDGNNNGSGSVIEYAGFLVNKPTINNFAGTVRGLLTAYTPAWTSSGTQPAIVDGTITGHYYREGDVVRVTIWFQAGASSTFGTGSYRWSLPFTAATEANEIHWGNGRITDSGIASFHADTSVSSGAAFINAFTAAGMTVVTNASPMTWGSVDNAELSITYTAVAV